ncbi:MAG: transglycosylase SLT domain-containing protein [Solirubrobacterales bacterium]
MAKARRQARAQRTKEAQQRAVVSTSRRNTVARKRSGEAIDKRLKATEEALTKKPVTVQQFAEDVHAARVKGVPVDRAIANTKSRDYLATDIPASTAIISSKGKAKAPPNPDLKGTAAERKAARANVHKAKRIVAKSSPDLSGLTPAQQEIARLDRKAHKKYPDVPVSVLMGDTEQESNFDPGAESSAGAFGATQFIPSTAAEYGVQKGTGKKEVRSQVFGQAHLLSDSTKQYGSTKEALGHYYGDPSASYSGEVLAKAQKYTFLDKAGNPQAIKNYKAAVKEAKELGLKVSARNTISAGPPPKTVVTKFRQIRHAANELESKGLPYSWGGGHDPNFSPGGEGENGGPGYDCSGAVSFVLHQAGVLKEPLTSGNMGSVLAPGPGAVTVFYNAGHTFMKIGNEYWGTSVGDSGSGGIGRHPAPSADYLAQYSVGHVPGLGRKQGLQLGFKPGSFTSSAGNFEAFPGMSLSEGGSTATIDQGKGTTKVKAGPSKMPIVLTPMQHYNRTERKLKALGVGAKKTKEEPSETLQALEAKYGVTTG